MENVVIDSDTKDPDYSDASLTENTQSCLSKRTYRKESRRECGRRTQSGYIS